MVSLPVASVLSGVRLDLLLPPRRGGRVTAGDEARLLEARVGPPAARRMPVVVGDDSPAARRIPVVGDWGLVREGLARLVCAPDGARPRGGGGDGGSLAPVGDRVPSANDARARTGDAGTSSAMIVSE